MKKLLLIITTLALLVCALNVGAFASPSEVLSDEPMPPEYYGRAALSELPNAKELIYAYDAITAGVDLVSDSIDVYDGEHTLSQDELKTALDAYRRDRADHFWLGNHYTISYNDETVTAFKPTYIFDASELPAKRDNFNEAVNAIIAGIPSIMGEFERALMLHDILAERLDYVLDAENAHNAYGALVCGEAVCEGYAEALQVLLMKAGIQSHLALGESKNPSNGVSEGHEWNYVRIDGKYYHVDLTWDDQDSYTYHAYLAVSDARIKEDHVITDADYALPVCDSEEANYFTVLGGKITSYTAKSVAERLRDGGMMGSFFLENTDAAAEFKTFLKNNIGDVAKELGIEGSYSYRLSSLGSEVYIYYDGFCKHPDAIYRDPASATCYEPGMKEHYYCPDCERYYLDRDLTVPATETEITISPLGHSYLSPCDKLCKTCGNERKAPHTLTKIESKSESAHTRSCACGESTLTEAHVDNNSDNKCDLCEGSLPTPIDTAKDIFGKIKTFFSHLKVGEDVTSILTVTVIASVIVILFIFIISRFFKKR